MKVGTIAVGSPVWSVGDGSGLGTCKRQLKARGETCLVNPTMPTALFWLELHILWILRHSPYMYPTQGET
jgi:hypothetical protein